MAAGFEGKPEIRSKLEARRHAVSAKRAWIDERQISDFGFRNYFGFRASDFAQSAESI